MKPRFLISLLLTVVAVFGATSPAVAQTCADPSVNVTATPSVAVEDTTVNYSYAFCHNTQGDRYTVQVFEVVGGVEQPVTTERSVRLNGSVGQESGSDAFTPNRAGRYKVVVAYFRVGQTAWEAKGEVVVKVNAAPAPQPTPTPTVPPVQPTPTPVQPQPTPEPVQPTPEPVVPVEDAPAIPVAKVEPVKTAKLAIVKRATKSTVKAGKTATFKLTVKSVGEAAAKNVVLCDPLPAKTQYKGASKPADFQGRSACFKLGTMKPGKTAKVTLRLTVDADAKGTIRNTATATASNAKRVKDTDTVRVKSEPRKRVHAPVTG